MKTAKARAAEIRRRGIYEPGTRFTSIEEMMKENLVYVKPWKRATSTAWIIGMAVKAVSNMIYDGRMVRAVRKEAI